MKRSGSPALPGGGSSRHRRLATPAAWISWKGIALLVAIALAIALRWSFVDFKSLDYYASLKPWYNAIKSQGVAAFSTGFSTYNPPYLYLLYLIARFLPDMPVVLAVKLPALIADFFCAAGVYLIVRLRYAEHNAVSWIAAAVVLFAPSVVLNSAFWGQADSIFTAGILGYAYLQMRQKSALAMIFFGVALAFKLQAIFLAPVILALCMRGLIPWRTLWAIPAILVLAIIPAWIAGRPIAELLNIYLYQSSQFEFITMNAASAYEWLPGTKQVFNLFYIPGVIMGTAAAYFLFVMIYRGRNALKPALVLELCLAATLIVPFFLPKMHERYFYPADILSIAFAFYYPAFFFIPILVGGVSFLSYEPFLFDAEPVPLGILTFVLVIAISLLTYHMLQQLYGAHPEESQAAGSDSSTDGAQGTAEIAEAGTL